MLIVHGIQRIAAIKAELDCNVGKDIIIVDLAMFQEIGIGNRVGQFVLDAERLGKARNGMGLLGRKHAGLLGQIELNACLSRFDGRGPGAGGMA